MNLQLRNRSGSSGFCSSQALVVMVKSVRSRDEITPQRSVAMRDEVAACYTTINRPAGGRRLIACESLGNSHSGSSPASRLGARELPSERFQNGYSSPTHPNTPWLFSLSSTDSGRSRSVKPQWSLAPAATHALDGNTSAKSDESVRREPSSADIFFSSEVFA